MNADVSVVDKCGAAFHGAPTCICPDTIARRKALLDLMFNVGPYEMFSDIQPD